MNKLLLATLCFLGTINSFGQLKPITKAEFESVLIAAQSKAEKTLRREVSEKTIYNDGKVYETQSETTETFPNGDSRWKFVSKEDGETISVQVLVIGKYEYRKEDDADWTKQCIKDCSPSEGSGEMRQDRVKMLASNREVEEFMVTKSTLEGQPVSVYVSYRVSEQGYIKTLRFAERKVWIGANGLVVMEQFKDSHTFPNVLSLFKIVKYEYDPKTIAPLEAPVN